MKGEKYQVIIDPSGRKSSWKRVCLILNLLSREQLVEIGNSNPESHSRRLEIREK
jgi:hypothetical protein